MTVLSITVLTILILNVYRATGTRQAAMRNNEAVLAGTGFGRSMLNEIKSKAFDENTVNKAVNSADSLTPVASLGPDNGEYNATQFNDIDDYNNYTRTDTLGELGAFYTKVKVYYIDNMSPGVKSNTPTFSKEVDVFISNFSLQDTLKFSQIFSY